LKKNFLQFLLLLALFFNIAHDTILSKNISHHESVHEYVLEQSSSVDCDDVCDIHHLFHFMAIIDDVSFSLMSPKTRTNLQEKSKYHTPPFQQNSIKPPIA